MKILAIRGANLASLPRFDIDLTAPPLASAGLFAITGDTGAGKSTILDALCLALYGTYPRVATKLQGDKIKDPGGDEVPADDPRNILRRGASSGFAAADFVGFDGRVYTAVWEVRRARDKADGRLQAATYRLDLKDGSASLATGRTNVESAVERATGFTFEQFKRTVLLAQGEFDAFLQAKESDRAELLEKITGYDIYSLISRRVFEETAQRKSALEAQRQTLAAIAVLDEPARLALIDERQQGHTKRESLAVDVQRLAGVITRIEAIAQAKQRVAEAETIERSMMARAKAGTPEKEKLAAIERSRPLAILSQRVDDSEAVLPRADAAAETAAAAIDAEEKASRQKADDLATSETAAANSAAAVAAAGPDWERARLLDHQIGATKASVAMSEKDVAERRGGAEKAAARRADAERAFIQVKDRIEALDAMLARSAGHETLASNVDAIKRGMAQRSEIAARLAEVRQRWLKAGRGALPDVSLQDAQRAVFQLAKSQQDNRSERTRLNPTALGDSDRALRSLADAVGEGKRLVAEAAEIDGQIETAKAEQSGAEAAEADAKARSCAVQSEKERLENERGLIAPLAEIAAASLSEAAAGLRHLLVPGEPCPVCGALEHPSADAALARAVAKRKQELDTSIAEADKALGHALLDQRGAQRSREQTRQRLDQSAKASAGVLEKLTVAARQIAAGAKGVGIAFDASKPAASLGAVTGEVAQLRAGVADKLEAVARLTAEIERTEGEHAAALEVRDAAMLSGQLHSNGQDLAPYLAVAGIDLMGADGDPAGVLAKLLGFGAEYCANKDRRDADGLLRASLERAHDKAQHDCDTAADALKAAEATLARQHEALAPFVAERANLLGGEALETHRVRLIGVDQSARAALKRAQDALTEAAKSLTAADTRRKSALEVLKAARASAAEAVKQFDANAAATGQTPEEVRALLSIPTDEVAALKASVAALDRSLADAATALDIQRRALADLLAAGKPPPADELPALKAEREQVAIERDHLISRLAEIAGDLKRDDEARAKAAGHDQEIAIAEAAHAVWADINAAIGQKDGALFRRFAQSVTLRELLALGDRKLAALNPRYGLKQGSVSDLGIEIVDRDMVEEVRSPRSLSGGERFLVSLALALALAELEGKSSFVDTLFIDEGFGSLDRETLDIAIDALERLQDDGRKVGVVTHVAAMIERIAVQVRVERQGGGRSRVRVVDGTGGAAG